MASIERTAYPRYKLIITKQELTTFFTPTLEETIQGMSIVDNQRLLIIFLVLLKSLQRLYYFPNLESIPMAIINHIGACIGYDDTIDLTISSPTLSKCKMKIREYLQIEVYNEEADKIVAETVSEMILIRDDPIDLINITLSKLINHRYELPAYSRIHNLTLQIRNQYNENLFNQVEKRLPPSVKDLLESFLQVPLENTIPFFSELKKLPKSATISHFKEWLSHLELLESKGNFETYLQGVTTKKLLCFAEEAETLDAGELKDYATEKRHTYLLALHHLKKMTTRDQLVDIFLKRMKTIHSKGKELLSQTILSHQQLHEQLIDTFAGILQLYEEKSSTDEQLVQSTKSIIDNQGGVESLLEGCNKVLAHRDNNHYPFLWDFFKSHRQAIFKLIENLFIQSVTEDNRLIIAKEVVLANKNIRKQYIPAVIELDFLSSIWRNMIVKNIDGQSMFHRHSLETCIFSKIADELRSGDLWIPGSLNYTDYRTQLLSWEECEPMVEEYCKNLKLPDTPTSLASKLQNELSTFSDKVDTQFPNNSECTIDEKGNFKLKRIKGVKPSPETRRILQLIQNEMPDRHLLDILAYADHYTNFTRHFSPSSGSDPKIHDPASMYRLTVFAYGSELGPTQISKHLNIPISAHSISYINRRHITSQKLEKADVDLINLYNQFALPKLWGRGEAVAADGTQIDTYRQNLIAEYHFRYGGLGGIAYYHVADNYIALFSNFIPCSIWEAVYILDGLLKNTSDIKPTKLHADTQGQTNIAFALAYFLGIELLPRIRNWKDLTFYRSSPQDQYKHIDSLFGEAIDWELIKTHWKDMMQVILSIKQGKIAPSMILKKLGSYSRQNKLYKAFQEVGRVRRTIFLLRYISLPSLRKEITSETNKVEIFNGFIDIIRFAGHTGLQTNDPVELDKRIKSTSVMANAVMTQNVLDMTIAINSLIAKGIQISIEDLKFLSPYQTKHIKRFGVYQINPDTPPPKMVTTLQLN